MVDNLKKINVTVNLTAFECLYVNMIMQEWQQILMNKANTPDVNLSCEDKNDLWDEIDNIAKLRCKVFEAQQAACKAAKS